MHAGNSATDGRTEGRRDGRDGWMCMWMDGRGWMHECMKACECMHACMYESMTSVFDCFLTQAISHRRWNSRKTMFHAKPMQLDAVVGKSSRFPKTQPRKAACQNLLSAAGGVSLVSRP